MSDVRDSPALEQAIRLLTPREHSVLELRQKLLKRNHSSETIDAVIAHLLDLNYLSDERFAEIYVAERICKGDGPMKIRSNLQKRGIERLLIERFLAQDDDFWLDNAREVLQKRFAHDGQTLPLAEWKRRRTFLHGRGFPVHVIQRTLGEFQSS